MYSGISAFSAMDATSSIPPLVEPAGMVILLFARIMVCAHASVISISFEKGGIFELDKAIPEPLLSTPLYMVSRPSFTATS